MRFQGQSLVAAAAGAAAVMVPAAAQLPVANTDAIVSFYQAVDCGGHYAENCGACPAGQGELWCNGECIWVNAQCEESNWWFRLVAYTHESFWLWYHTLPITFLIGLIMTAYAVVYKKKIVDDIPQEAIHRKDADFDRWEEREVGLFDCFKYPSQCLWATFCTPVVSGKNYHTSDVMPFWPSCCLVFVGLFSFFWPLYCIMACVRTKLSGDLQRNMGFKPNFCLDFIVTLFCFPCEVGRESIEVNDKLGVTLKCPFEVEKSLAARGEMLVEAAERSCTRVCS